MNKKSKTVMTIVVILTIASIVTWQATGGDWYTKYEVVEQVESKPDPNDPLVAAGFYESGTTTQTVTRNEFRFGLLPTPAGILDKHALSVASVTIPLWVLGLGFVWFQRRNARRYSQ
jgi:hypothetical protein